MSRYLLYLGSGHQLQEGREGALQNGRGYGGKLSFNLKKKKGGGGKRSPPFKRGSQKVLPYLQAGDANKKFLTCNFLIL